MIYLFDVLGQIRANFQKISARGKKQSGILIFAQHYQKGKPYILTPLGIFELVHIMEIFALIYKVFIDDKRFCDFIYFRAKKCTIKTFFKSSKEKGKNLLTGACYMSLESYLDGDIYQILRLSVI